MVDQHAAPPHPRPDVVSDIVIIGGGIAGISAAIALLDAGHRVTLVEARQFLGGRAFSFADAATGQPVDNGQHVIVGCCAYFIHFLERLGVSEQWYLQPRLRLRVVGHRGREGLLTAAPLPAPFHLLPSFLTYPHLSLLDKARCLAGLLRARFTDRRHPGLEQITFRQWLKENGQSDRAIQNLWNLLVEPTLNDNVRDVSAAMGLMIVQEGVLQGPTSANVGFARAGLQSAIGDPARQLLEQLGGRLILGRPARRILLNSGQVAGVELASGETVTGQAYVSALPFGALLSLLPPEALSHDYFGRLTGLESSPIVNIHLWYDRQVMDGDFCAFIDCPLQWVFNKSGILGSEEPSQGQYICISLSAAWDYIECPREELARRFIAEMAEAFPAARDARVVRATVVKQRDATFRCRPGANALRPGARTPLSNLALAGEWTDTGWPSTMEGAVRSGYSAAQAAQDLVNE